MTGSINNVRVKAEINPPTMGAAMRFITWAPVAVPNMTGYAREFADLDRSVLEEIVNEFDNKSALEGVTARLRAGI